MGENLKSVLGLPDAKSIDASDQADEFRQSFTAGMAELNSHCQSLAGQACRADFESLETQKLKLYEAFQKTSKTINANNGNNNEPTIQRVLGALEVVKAKAAKAAAGVATSRDEWLKREDTFDDVLARIGEIEDAGNPQAATLRKLATMIRGRVNDHAYAESVRALDQLQPKLDTIYQRHQQGSAAGTPGTAAESPNAADVPLTGVSPDVVWQQSQASFHEAESMVGELQSTQLPKAPLFGKAMERIRALADQQKFSEANTGYQRLRPQIDAEYAKLMKSRGGGVQMPAGPGGPSGGLAASGPATNGAAGTAKGAGGFIAGSVGKGGKNEPADVKAVQEALNQRGGAKLTADGKIGPKTLKAIVEFQKKLGQFKPDGNIQPGRGTARALSGAAELPPPPAKPKPIAPPVLGKASLDKGALVWHSTRGILTTNIDELKKGVRAAYGTEVKELVTEIDDSMVKLGDVVDKLDTRLADALDSANKSPEGPARATELKRARLIIDDYHHYVNSEPLIAHMDNNPFGVTTSLRRIIGDALDHLGELMPPSTEVIA